MMRAAGGGTRCCFIMAIMCITFGLVFGMMGVVYVATGLLRALGVSFLVVGLGVFFLGIGLCVYAKSSATRQFRERAAEAPQGPVVCGLLPGQPVAGNYLDQRPPQHDGGFSQVAGSYSSAHPRSHPSAPHPGSQQHGSSAPQVIAGYPLGASYPPQSGAAGFSHQQHHAPPSAPPPAEVMGSPPSYDDVVYGPAGKSRGASHV